MRSWKAEILRRLDALQLSPDREAEIADELLQHMSDRYEQLMNGGAPADEAEDAVLRELDSNELFAHRMRTVERRDRRQPIPIGSEGGTGVFSDVLQDVRYGVRMLLKSPGFTAIAVIALALGIGANTAIFSVVNTVLLRPLPYKDPERLVMVWEDASQRGYPKDTPAPANYIDWRDQNQAFQSMAAAATHSFNLTGVGEPERLDGRRVSAAFFPILGVEPQLGRVFIPEEDQPGANRVAVISNRLWQRRFSSDPTIIGKNITLNNESVTVIGVMPPQFQFPTPQDDVFVPIAFTSEQAAARQRHYLEVIGRLKPGVTLEQAQADMNTIGARLRQQYPDSNKDLGVVVTSLHEHIVGDIKPALLVLLGAVALVLLIACANVANLLLARGAARQKEIALRVAVGANRWRLVRQFLTESILLALFGGIVGVLLAFAGLRILNSFVPETISQVKAIGIDPMVLGFTLVVSLLTGLIFGLVPAIQASVFNPNETLKEGGRDSAAGSRGNRIRATLVVSEVAISLILLAGAGLLINSFMRLSSVDPGFKTDNLLTMGIVLPETKYSEHAQRSAFYTEMIRRVESLPGVSSVAVTNWIPLVRQGDSVGISIEGRTETYAPPRPPMVTRVVSPGYFNTMGIQLIKGRQFDAQLDRIDSQPVAIISETTAQRFWPNQDPIGKRLSFNMPDENDWLQVIGVAKDVRQFQLNAESRPQMYLMYTQVDFFAPRNLVVRTNVDPLSLAGTVRKTVWEVDKDQPVSNISTMEEVLSDSIARQGFSTLLLGIFAGLALVLAAVGIYGVMSYSVTQRRREIGIRMALGAQKADVLKLTVGQGLKLGIAGVALGLVAALSLTRVMATLLFGISATDPTTFITIALLLTSVAILASYIPARRATKVDPMIALRYE